MHETGLPGALGSNTGLGPNATLVERLRQERRPTAWTRGIDVDYPTAWEPNLLCHEAAAEIERLRAALKKANDQAEHFERLWYLTNEDAARYAFAKTLEGQVVTMETFKVRGAAELDQAIDDAMAEEADAHGSADLGPNVGANRRGTDGRAEGQNEMAACSPGSRVASG